jgi:hypothetical protein
MKSIWWLHPGKLLLFFLVPVYLFVVFVVPTTWPRLIVLKGGMYANGSPALLGLAVLLAVGIFGVLGAHVAIDSRQLRSPVVLDERLLTAIGGLAIAAYLIWFYPAVLKGSMMADREAMGNTPGVTSFTQLGVPFVVCYLTGRLVGGQKFSRVIRWQFASILFLTVVRVQLWSERLAMIEVVAPMAVLVLTHRAPRTRVGRTAYQVVGLLGPFLAIPALLLIFTVTEFFRSWTVYSQTQDLPLIEFMTSRLITYYFTAINNGAGLLVTQEGRWPTFDLYYTLEWAYHLPLGIGHSLQDAMMGKEAAHGDFLLNFADVEFNNMSGIYPIIFDLGEVGGLLYFSVFGFVAGVLYRSMINGRALGLILYPPMFTGCLEVMRIAYLNGPRALLILFGCTFAYLQVRSAQGRLSHAPLVRAFR